MEQLKLYKSIRVSIAIIIAIIGITQIAFVRACPSDNAPAINQTTSQEKENTLIQQAKDTLKTSNSTPGISQTHDHTKASNPTSKAGLAMPLNERLDNAADFGITKDTHIADKKREEEAKHCHTPQPKKRRSTSCGPNGRPQQNNKWGEPCYGKNCQIQQEPQYGDQRPRRGSCQERGSICEGGSCSPRPRRRGSCHW
ncbi:hypothetical protein NEFER03_0461 [Nematocida sp. LUAm3]|nr:hypothetical protein NEFER03_0461 [Nematocida sp. LUAm3]KAI5175918.1 hypothetical protein NEFER02_1778 [Nematocida sp. LUAm2]KAI5178700.1 hypothetical protein NEFER01_1819 [Nematocida sp. LUAm1]